jgi:hypothetical protein
MWDGVLKFVVEILRDNRVVHRAVIDEQTPAGALPTAENILAAWWRRGTTIARVLNQQGEEVYRLDH